MAETTEQQKDNVTYTSDETKHVTSSSGDVEWYVLRDLKRPNAINPAYKMLPTKDIEVFTPMMIKETKRGTRKVLKKAPIFCDLLFAHSSRAVLDPIISKTVTLQYRYIPGGYKKVMTVRPEDMETFIKATTEGTSIRYYKPEEITDDMIGKKLHIVGGPLDGKEVELQKIRGTKKKRILVKIPDVIVASVVIDLGETKLQ